MHRAIKSKHIILFKRHRIFNSTVKTTHLSIRKGRLCANACLRAVELFGIQMHKHIEVVIGTYIPHPMSKKGNQFTFLLCEIPSDIKRMQIKYVHNQLYCQ
jgi:hypothetical protein